MATAWQRSIVLNVCDLWYTKLQYLMLLSEINYLFTAPFIILWSFIKVRTKPIKIRAGERGDAIDTFQTCSQGLLSSCLKEKRERCMRMGLHNYLSFFSDFGIWYFWEFKRNWTNLCRFPKSWVINRSLKVYFCFNICVTYG